MGNVSVTRDSLHKIKASLKDFQTSVETSTSHMRSHAEDVVTSMRASIKKQEVVVMKLKDKAEQITFSVEQCQAQIIGNNNRISKLKRQIENTSSRMRDLENQIAKLRMQKQQLQSQNSSSGNGSNDTSAQIRTIESQIQSCEKQQYQMREQIASLRNQESSLNTQNDKLRSDKINLDAALAKTKSDFVHAGEKCNQMKHAGGAAESCIAKFLGIAQQYKQTVLTTNSAHTSGLEKCIAAIDEYETVNLSNGNSGGNRSDSSSNTGLPRLMGNMQQVLDENPSAMRERTLYELSVLRDDLELSEGNPALPQLGGSYREVRKQLKALGIRGYAAHHIPSAAAQGADHKETREYYESLPTIAISNIDHMETDSYGGNQNSRYQSFLPDVPISASYCDEITAEIESGNFIEVVRNEIYNIRDHFGHDYDGGISRYLDALESFLQGN